jgi:peptidoglycan-N-acetylglucosamine deacetylase
LQKEYPNIVVLHGNPANNRVALTFDDGPDIRFTPQVLDILAKHDVKATFFLIGARAGAHREITKRIHDEGHAIGNHTYWHPNLPNESLERLRWELTETEKVIEDIIGFKPRLFRSPYGALNEEIVKTLSEMDHTVIGWDVDSVD